MTLTTTEQALYDNKARVTAGYKQRWSQLHEGTKTHAVQLYAYELHGKKYQGERLLCGFSATIVDLNLDREATTDNVNCAKCLKKLEAR